MVEIGCLGTHTAAWHGRVAGQLIPTPITHWILWGHWIESARLWLASWDRRGHVLALRE